MPDRVVAWLRAGGGLHKPGSRRGSRCAPAKAAAAAAAAAVRPCPRRAESGRVRAQPDPSRAGLRFPGAGAHARHHHHHADRHLRAGRAQPAGPARHGDRRRGAHGSNMLPLYHPIASNATNAQRQASASALWRYLKRRRKVSRTSWYLHTRVRVPFALGTCCDQGLVCRGRCHDDTQGARDKSRWASRSGTCCRVSGRDSSATFSGARLRRGTVNPQAPAGCSGDLKQQRVHTIAITDRG